MLLRFLKETKKESYFNGLQDNVPVGHSYDGNKFDNLALVLASMLSDKVTSASPMKTPVGSVLTNIFRSNVDCNSTL